MIHQAKIEDNFDCPSSHSVAIINASRLDDEYHVYALILRKHPCLKLHSVRGIELGVYGIDDAIGEGSGDHTLAKTSKPAQRLLCWCRAVCASSELRIPIFNFTTSFADGRALCAILNFYHPTVLPLSEMHKTTTDLVNQAKGTKSRLTVDAWSAALY